tara:strand:+ start:339 stop:764 length:426 start_codon:yes stop_codon:yes gene_type:complete
MDSSNCDISSNELSSSPKNDYIDEITLQLLINKQCKSKYLMQHDPEKYKQEEEYKQKVIYYKDDIANIFNDYSNIRNHQVTSDLDDAYNNFIKACLKHFEIKEVEQDNTYNNDTDTDNVLFQNCGAFSKGRSYWGKGVKKI